MRRNNDHGHWDTAETGLLTDETGRTGVVTDIRDYALGPGLFARPAALAYLERMVMPGVGEATCITATWWARQPDGTYRGCWADSPADTVLSATLALRGAGDAEGEAPS